jgi:hypothetical protein
MSQNLRRSMRVKVRKVVGLEGGEVSAIWLLPQ